MLEYLIRKQDRPGKIFRQLVVPFSKIIAEVCIGISPLKSRSLLAKLRLESPQLMEVMVPETGSLRAER